MAVTYEPIASQTLGSDAASVTFSSIGGGWTDLIILAHTRLTGSFSATTYGIRFNSDTGSNYSSTQLLGTGSVAQSQRDTSVTYAYVSTSTAATGAANVFTPVIIHIMSYANSNVFKTVLAASDAENARVVRTVGLWRSTSAITSVTLVPVATNQGDFKSGCTFSLYGIKAA